MIDIPYLPQIIVVVLAIIVLYLVVQLGKKITDVLLNSLFGIVALLIVNTLPFVAIKINAWSILIAGIGGIVGVIILLALSYFGIVF